ncbi:MAG TPA: SUF system NifU family Fe-S cluster assembly protein [Thermoanaerobaculia bacterium]|nr:SUF system NifU family Fe-S cluster assembly protein [Thermoanaerobaculia bacterium]
MTGAELRELYQDVILDHGKRPRNFGRLPAANRSAQGDNPLCGDRLTLTVEVADGRVADAAFEGAGCAISVASASLMTDAVKGLPVAEAEALFHRFHRLLAGERGGAAAAGGEAGEDLGKLAVFAGVREYPMRVKCATLPWHTLIAALHSAPAADGAPAASVSTE